MVEEVQQRLEEERKAHADKLGGERDRLLERERNAGVLEGRVDAMGAEAEALRLRIAELEGQTKEKDQLRTDLENARKSQEDLQRKKEEYQKRLEDISRKKQPKC